MRLLSHLVFPWTCARLVVVTVLSWPTVAAFAALVEGRYLPVDSPETDLVWPIQDSYAPGSGSGIAIDLPPPSNIEDEVIYDPVTGQYIVRSTVGGSFNYRPPMSMDLEEYLEYDMERSMQTYWTERVEGESASSVADLVPSIKVKGEAFDRIFGGNTISIRPQGSAEVIFGLNTSKTENPRIPVNQRSITTFNFDQRIQLNLQGNIGEKLKINTSYNTEATFDFENQVKLDYTGGEDEIIQKIEAGNVSLPLQGQLIQGSQSLFGLKTELRFGRLTATGVFSQEKGQRKNVQVSGGAQTTTFEIKGDEYEANRYYFLGHFFRDQYENALRTLPFVNSPVQITRVEVWITNTRFEFEQTRNIVAFADLGEDAVHISPDVQGVVNDLRPDNLADNGQNNLYATVSNNADVRGFVNATSALQPLGLSAARHFERLESARLLGPNEYVLNPRLGFISLNQSLNNDEVLAVAYQYVYQGQTFQVGEFSTDGPQPPNALLLRLLKSTITNPRIPLWDLMMKNVYSLGAFQVNREDFRLDILYNNPATGIDVNFVPRAPIDDDILLQVLGVDRLDPQNAPNPDGWFDFVDGAFSTGGTVNTQNGRIVFPVLEPFGTTLNAALIGPDPGNPIQPESVRKSVVFQVLYDSTKVAAQNQPELNRFKLKGTYRSASSDLISLNSVNIPQGSVSVTAGGVRLVENQDYTVDYNLGRVKILNQGLLESGTPINISLESNSLFSIQARTLAGARFDYKVNKDFTMGGTIMNLYERPLTAKVNAGDEPIRNTIVGVDANWKTESQWLTGLVDRLPFYATKEMSNVNASVEAAYLIPGHSPAIGDDGTSYVDDFEGSVSVIDMRQQSLWQPSATPQGVPDLFPEGERFGLDYGYRRSKLSWYVIDPLFFRDNPLKPDNITSAMQSDHRMREVLEQEVFPNRQLAPGTPANIPVLDLAYYPGERGPYNYTPDLTSTGGMPDPVDSWAGITRRVTTTDFEASNIETIQLWMMDPFSDAAPNSSNEDSENTTGGDLYINLGNISEDILRDSRKAFENGLPVDLADQNSPTAESEWGVVPTTQTVVNAFAITERNSNAFQDVGLDGLASAQDDNQGRSEQSFFADYLNSLDPGARAVWQGDPSGDDYRFFRSDLADQQNLDILERYKDFNGLESNSETDEDSPEDFPTQQTTLPSTEDINLDQNLAEAESYFQYRISLRPEDMVVGKNFITDRIEGTANTPDGAKTVYWYQFKIPIRQPERAVNGIQDLRSVRFMRVYMKGWAQPAVLRFARMEFVRGEWRKYFFGLETPGEVIGGDPEPTTFEVAAVNIEENGKRVPINYVVPPGINREIDVASANQRNLNEQSLQLVTCNLRDGDARAAFRNVQFDIRSYKKLRMYVHAETGDDADPITYGDISVFVRLGNDYDQNYYEYELAVEPSADGNQSPENVWPEANNLEIEFATLNDIKLERNQNGFPVTQRFMKMISDPNGQSRRLTVKGNPNLAQLKSVMVGIRNPKRDGEEGNPWKEDDGVAQCAEVWVNELRLTDFDQRGGWAAVGRVSADLADLGNVSVAGSYSTPFWGSIDKRVSERQRETKLGVDVAANFELGKFLPEKSGVKVPLFLGFSETISNPQFDPLAPDIEWSDATRALTAEQRKARLRTVRSYTRRRSMNFTNVHKERAAGAKDQVWDVENLSLSYGYSEMDFHDVNTEYENERQHRGSLAYQHNPKPKLVKPFDKVGLLAKSKWLRPVKEFNFYTGIKQVTMRTSMDRAYTERLMRTNSEVQTLPPLPTYNKNFNWNSQYGLRYEITKSLKLDFNANNNAILGEPPGQVDPKQRNTYEVWKDSVLTSLRSFGVVRGYNHTVNMSYQLPLDKFPLTDWTNVTTTYGAGYQWDRAPFQQDTLGNTIQNSQTISINGQLNFVNLYNKNKWLKKINDRGKNSRTGRKASARQSTDGDADKDKAKKDEEKKPEEKTKLTPAQGVARGLMAIRNGTFTYSQNSGMLLPGWGKPTNALGMEPGFGAPGVGFILGQQNHNLSGDIVRDFATEAAERDWLVRTSSIFSTYNNTRTETMNGRLSLEPAKSFRIELLANRTSSLNRTSFFRFNDSLDTYVNDSPIETGNFSVSTITWGTTFTRDDNNDLNATFEQLLDNRAIISERLGRASGNSEFLPDSGFWDGFGPTSQSVLLPAFVAAYTGKDARSAGLNPFKLVPMPNWDASYDGLGRIPAFQKWFRTVTVNHSYRSTFNIAQFQTNLEYDPNSAARDAVGNFIPARLITVVTISEVMRPFLNFDMTLQNSLLAKFEYNRDRSLSMSLTNYQITEVRGKEFVIGSGYRFKSVRLPFAVGGTKPQSDMNLRVDLSWRQNNTVIRKMQERQNEPTAGQDIISLKTSADYVLNQRLNVRAFYERVINRPVISTSFPTSNTNTGISIRFTLAQ
jgi:cell surface protein SprA